MKQDEWKKEKIDGYKNEIAYVCNKYLVGLSKRKNIAPKSAV